MAFTGRLRLFGLTRATKNLTLERIGRANGKNFDGGVREDSFVDVGSGDRATPQTLSLIRYRRVVVSIRLLTNVVEPEHPLA